MYRGLHHDIEQLTLPRLRVYELVISALDAEQDLKCVRDDNVALLISVREVQLIARAR